MNYRTLPSYHITRYKDTSPRNLTVTSFLRFITAAYVRQLTAVQVVFLQYRQDNCYNEWILECGASSGCQAFLIEIEMVLQHIQARY